MELKLNIILFISLLSGFNLFAQTSTTSSGVWSNGSNWTSGVPGSNDSANVNHDMTLDVNLLISNGGHYIVNNPLTDPVGGIEYNIDLSQTGNLDVNNTVTIGGDLTMIQNSTLFIRSYDTLIIRGNAEFIQQTQVMIEPNGVLFIEGNLVLRQQSTNTVNGKIYVKGNITANQNATIDGTGNVEAEGDVTLNNGTMFFGNDTSCVNGCEYGSGVGLPIELKRFEAKLHPHNKNLVLIKWTTLSEVNNHYFIIEHSVDGKNFETIDRIGGAGNSNNELNYSSIVSIDNSSAQHYFRLKQVDYDGSSKTFNAVALKHSNHSVSDAKKSLTAHPNPSNGKNLKLSLQNFKAGAYSFVLMNSNGQTIVEKSINLQNGVSNQSLDLLNNIQLSKGVYYIHMMSEEPITKKIVVN